jgi:hypothetical protein
MKKIFIATWLVAILSAISYIFWYNDWKYSLPTPVPAKYSPATKGEHISLNNELATPPDKPVFLHFFNPNCPCSRFNMRHFKSLVRHYGDKISFAMVVVSKDNYTAEEIQDKYDLNIPVSFDRSTADLCGVYSTPQAVILDENRNLYYRGNYNKSRYCVDKNTNYAQNALEMLLNKNPNPVFAAGALKAYGCELQVCKK